VNKSAEVPPSQTGAVHVSPRETQEYKVALELEMWKQQQESLFEEQVSKSVVLAWLEIAFSEEVASRGGIIIHELS